MSLTDDVTVPRLSEEYRNRYYEQGVWRDETLVSVCESAVESGFDTRRPATDTDVP